MTASGVYRSWTKLRDRCLNPTSSAYPNYGGRGIKIDPRWGKFENFLADMGERPDGMTLERIDTNGDYTKANCRWASRAEQMRNTRRTRFLFLNGEMLCASDAAIKLGIDRNRIWEKARKKKIPLQDALDYFAAKR